ncbi:hypothetical protein [Mycobacterium deserti]|uniref:Lipoprotein n=1 Tax=Mycobacterium deserti TaxID=2978347 RepID=A0ABT2M7Z8_9MYCO|nr:hypothetical protein [Mycobacterium deserti]MCT7658388.1 hypothetical protein [Mycobacterium deserti]
MRRVQWPIAVCAVVGALLGGANCTAIAIADSGDHQSGRSADSNHGDADTDEPTVRAVGVLSGSPGDGSEGSGVCVGYRQAAAAQHLRHRGVQRFG